MQGCQGQGKTKIFQCQGIVREFFKKSGKILVLDKVSKKSGNFFFQDSTAFCEVVNV